MLRLPSFGELVQGLGVRNRIRASRRAAPAPRLTRASFALPKQPQSQVPAAARHNPPGTCADDSNHRRKHLLPDSEVLHDAVAAARLARLRSGASRKTITHTTPITASPSGCCAAESYQASPEKAKRTSPCARGGPSFGEGHILPRHSLRRVCRSATADLRRATGVAAVADWVDATQACHVPLVPSPTRS